MKKSLLLICVLSVFMFSGLATAATIDFESVALGSYSSLDFGDFVLTADDGSFDVTAAAPGPPISGNVILNNYDIGGFYLDFSLADVTSFSIGVGDYNSDVDNTFLEVFDIDGNLLASDSYVNPASTNGGDFLSVLTTFAISSVHFWDAEPYPGAVYWDMLSYDVSETAPVPEPSTILLLGAGLLGLAGYSRKRSKKS